MISFIIWSKKQDTFLIGAGKCMVPTSVCVYACVCTSTHTYVYIASAYLYEGLHTCVPMRKPGDVQCPALSFSNFFP